MQRHLFDVEQERDVDERLREDVDHYVEKVEAMRRKLGEQDW